MPGHHRHKPRGVIGRPVNGGNRVGKVISYVTGSTLRLKVRSRILVWTPPGRIVLTRICQRAN